MKDRTYIAIDLKSFYASVECRERDLDPLDTNLVVIGHTGDLPVDIYTAKYDAYLHFTAVLNDGGKGAQFRRNGCSI